MIFELKTFLRILFLKPIRLSVSVISFGKKLKTFAPRKAKRPLPSCEGSLGQREIVLLLGVSGEFLNGVEIAHEDSQESKC